MHGKYVAYHRVSTKEQNLDRGINEIMEYCREHKIVLHKNKVYTDKQTGKHFDRPSYNMLKEEILESGDTLIISELDRLGRDKNATLKEIRWLKDHGIRLLILELAIILKDIPSHSSEEQEIMTDTMNNMVIEIFTALAHTEMLKRVKRQREGIEQMKKRGEWDKYGRPRVMDLKAFKKEYEAVERGEIKPFELMKKLGMTKSTYYRYKKLCSDSSIGTTGSKQSEK